MEHKKLCYAEEKWQLDYYYYPSQAVKCFCNSFYFISFI